MGTVVGPPSDYSYMFLTILDPPYPHHPPQRAKIKKMKKNFFWLFVQFKASELL